MELKAQLSKRQKNIEKLLVKYLPNKNQYNERVIEALSYSLLTHGKRIRPIFMLEAYKLCCGSSQAIEGCMVAIEMIHTYSLIHDDLPALDNDILRRGKPTCHVKYGEDIAILAGDALLNRAFEVLINVAITSIDRNILMAIKTIVDSAGTDGMIGGQVADVLNEGQSMTMDCLNYIHLKKTSSIIEACFVAGAYIAGATESNINILRQIGRDIGLAFQIQDDILDVIGSEDVIGKPINSDEKNNKITYVSFKGIDTSNELVNELLDDALKLLGNFENKQSEFMKAFIEFLRTRKK